MSGQGTDQAIKADKSFTRALNQQIRVAAKLESLVRRIENTPDGTHFITSIKFKMSSENYHRCLAIVQATTPDGKVVAWLSGDSLGDCLVSIENHLANGTMKWKKDKPYDQRNAD